MAKSFRAKCIKQASAGKFVLHVVVLMLILADMIPFSSGLIKKASRLGGFTGFNRNRQPPKRLERTHNNEYDYDKAKKVDEI